MKKILLLPLTFLLTACSINITLGDWKEDMIPKNFIVERINNDELRFKSNSSGTNLYSLAENRWKDGTPITMIVSKEDFNKSDCVRGTTLNEQVVKNNNLKDVNNFQCFKSLFYRGPSSAKRFVLRSLVLKETKVPNIFDVVSYKFEQEAAESK